MLGWEEDVTSFVHTYVQNSLSICLHFSDTIVTSCCSVTVACSYSKCYWQCQDHHNSLAPLMMYVLFHTFGRPSTWNPLLSQIVLPHITTLHHTHSLSQVSQCRAVEACTRTQGGWPPVRSNATEHTHLCSAPVVVVHLEHCHTSTQMHSLSIHSMWFSFLDHCGKHEMAHFVNAAFHVIQMNHTGRLREHGLATSDLLQCCWITFCWASADKSAHVMHAHILCVPSPDYLLSITHIDCVLTHTK